MVETLLDHLKDGTLVMPTMTWRSVTPENPVWDERTTASHTGILTEIFRVRYASARSIHPTHSAASAGKAAKILLARHQVGDTPVSANSPYGLMRDYDAHVLMLGVGLEACTAVHLSEEMIAEDIYLRPRETSVTYSCTDCNGVVHQVAARRHWPLHRDFPKFGPPLEAKGQLRAGDIDDCPYILVALRHLLRETTAALIVNPYATLRDGRIHQRLEA
jgi:aminoglycoside 3-N-acetyltransferase